MICFFPEMAVAYSNSQRWLDDLFAADAPQIILRSVVFVIT